MLRHILVLSLLLASVACADDANHGTLKVDLATVVEQGAVVPVDGISSAGQPDAAALKVFADSGYVAVIDMRTAAEDRGFDERAVVTDLGMEYVDFPIDAEDITLDKARQLEELLVRYDQPVLLHCASANRVGALLALREFLASGDTERALQKGREGGMTRLEAAVRDVLDQVTAGPPVTN